VVTLDKKVPDFAAPSTGGTFKLSAQRGHRWLLYFYPKDNTPGCTMEGAQSGPAQAVREDRRGHRRRIARQPQVARELQGQDGVSLRARSDAEEKLCSEFDVIKMKNMYGRKVRGIERSTFVIDAKGTLVREWRKVKVPGHAEEVLAVLKAL